MDPFDLDGADRLLTDAYLIDRLMDGWTTAEIADVSKRSRGTVRNRIHFLMRRYGVSTRAALVARILVHGRETSQLA